MAKESRYQDYEYQSRPHPEPRQYVQIAVALAFVIALELTAFYLVSSRGLLLPMLAIFAAIKFFLIGAWFMHLRFDSPIFRRLFISGLILAVSVFAIALSIFIFATPLAGTG